MRLDPLVERWRAARAAMISMPFGDPQGRARLNDLSEAEHALFQAAGGMAGPPFGPGSDTLAMHACPCPDCACLFFTERSMQEHLRDKRGPAVA